MKIIAKNKRASFDFHIEERYEAGVVLLGSELKSIRNGKLSINEAFVTEDNGELFAQHINISKYSNANRFNHNETRPRKLLLHRREINKILGKIKVKGYSAIISAIYFNKKNFVKIEVVLGKGKKLYDKREAIKDREWKRDKQRDFKYSQ